jgi:hypothetical protein
MWLKEALRGRKDMGKRRREKARFTLDKVLWGRRRLSSRAFDDIFF